MGWVGWPGGRAGAWVGGRAQMLLRPACNNQQITAWPAAYLKPSTQPPCQPHMQHPRNSLGSAKQRMQGCQPLLSTPILQQPQADRLAAGQRCQQREGQGSSHKGQLDAGKGPVQGLQSGVGGRRSNTVACKYSPSARQLVCPTADNEPITTACTDMHLSTCT